MKTFIAWLIIGIVVVLGGWYYFTHKTQTKTVSFDCDQGKSITAIFDLAPTGGVKLNLSDGRNLTLAHTVSADGARYANADESIVFWNVGNTATLSENGSATYANCAVAGTASPVSQQAGGTVTNSGVVSTYTNDTYGFSITYPQDLTATSTFDHFYNLSDHWRANASVNADNVASGTDVVMIPVFEVNHGGVATGQPYPLYFAAEARVGVSSDPTEVANCTKPDQGYTAEPEKDTTMGGATWKAYTFQDQAMMQYVAGVSYRTVHGGMCYAVEAVKTGSVYKDDTMTAGLSDDQLNQYFTEAQNIAESFMFTK